MLALSTSWNTSFNRSGTEIIEEVKKLGFNSFELGFSHTKTQLAQILKAKDIDVVSLHNYCPIPEGLPQSKALPDSYSLSSPNNAERKAALSFTKRTIRCAKKFKARVVILHCGRVQTLDYTKQLFRLRNNKNCSSEFERLKQLAIKERDQKKAVFLDKIFLSVQELADFAHNEGISLGIENRIYIREIPNFEEIPIILKNFSKKGVGYWHDTGHAYILDKLGFTKHTHYLKAYHRHLLGIHLHDVQGFNDHKAPCSGEIDFRVFKPYMKKKTIKVIEAHQPTTPQEIVYAKKKIEHLFNS